MGRNGQAAPPTPDHLLGELRSLQEASTALLALYRAAYPYAYSERTRPEVRGRSGSHADPVAKTVLEDSRRESIRGQLRRTSRKVAAAVNSLRAADHALARSFGLPVDHSRRGQALAGRSRLKRALRGGSRP